MKTKNESFGTNPWDPWSAKDDIPDAKNDIALQKMKKIKIVAKPKLNKEGGVPVNDPWVGIDSKANLTRVAEAVDRKELSKSARLIKSIYKKNGMNTSKKTELQSDAKAILTGGKTLTGQPRDTIEIDPSVKVKDPNKKM